MATKSLLICSDRKVLNYYSAMLELLRIDHEPFSFFTRGFRRLMETRSIKNVFVVLLDRNEFLGFQKLSYTIDEDKQDLFMILGDRDLDKYFMHKNYEIMYHGQLIRPFEQVMVANRLCKSLEAAMRDERPKEPIFDYIKRILEKGDIILPIKRDIAFQMLPALEEDDVSLQEIALMTRLDPGIHAGLIKMSNSVHFSGVYGNIKDIESAIVRVGTVNIKMFLINYINRSLANNKDLLYHEQINQAVEDSLRTASIAHVVADTMKSASNGLMFSIGMIHKLGLIFLLAIISDYLSDEEMGEGMMEENLKLAEANQKSATVAMLKKWKFKPEFYLPVQFQDEPAKCKYPVEARTLRMAKILHRYYSMENEDAAQTFLKKSGLEMNASQIMRIKALADEHYQQTRLLLG
ncbi:HDOD domain-containing protein [Limisalsivibrio acetivorans]|uniref:HDOD domain-containing protein n=1 Tax=Limisalsivibrio acetivorans TaxID=1304888 RepID=UPI0003B32FFB|nr:HDOD domain-containing protein [Limisalsivibrio acetivorans]